MRTSTTAGLGCALALAVLTVGPAVPQGSAPARVGLPTDRTVLPIPEPTYPPITELDARFRLLRDSSDAPRPGAS